MYSFPYGVLKDEDQECNLPLLIRSQWGHQFESCYFSWLFIKFLFCASYWVGQWVSVVRIENHGLKVMEITSQRVFTTLYISIWYSPLPSIFRFQLKWSNRFSLPPMDKLDFFIKMNQLFLCHYLCSFLPWLYLTKTKELCSVFSFLNSLVDVWSRNLEMTYWRMKNAVNDQIIKIHTHVKMTSWYNHDKSFVSSSMWS